MKASAGSDGTSQSSVIASRQGSGSRWGTKGPGSAPRASAWSRTAGGAEAREKRGRRQRRERAERPDTPALEGESEVRLGLEKAEGARGEERLLRARGHYPERCGDARRQARQGPRRRRCHPHRQPDRRARRDQPLPDPPLVAEERGEPAEVEAEPARLDHLDARRGRPRGIEERPGRHPLGDRILHARDEIGDARRGLGGAHAGARPARRRVRGDRDDRPDRRAPERRDRAPLERRVLPDQRRGGEARRPDTRVAWLGRGHPRPRCAGPRAGGADGTRVGPSDSSAVHTSGTLGPGARVRDRINRASVASPASKPGPPGVQWTRRGTSATATAARLPATRRGPAIRSPIPPARPPAAGARTRPAGCGKRPGRQVPQIDRDQLESATLDEDVRGPPRGGKSAAAADPEETAQRDPDHRGRRRIEPVRAIDERRPAAARGGAREGAQKNPRAPGGARAHQLRELAPREAPVEERVERRQPGGGPRTGRAGARPDVASSQDRVVHHRFGRRAPGACRRARSTASDTDSMKKATEQRRERY